MKDKQMVCAKCYHPYQIEVLTEEDQRELVDEAFLNLPDNDSPPEPVKTPWWKKLMGLE